MSPHSGEQLVPSHADAASGHAVGVRAPRVETGRHSAPAERSPAPDHPVGPPPLATDDGGIVVMLARGFDALGVHAPVVVQMGALSSGRPAQAAAWADRSAALQAATDDPEASLPWLMTGLKALALAAALGGAYLAGLFLLGAPSPGPAQLQAPPPLGQVWRP